MLLGGIILIVLGALLGIGIIETLGIVLAVVGVIILVWGVLVGPIGGRRHFW